MKRGAEKQLSKDDFEEDNGDEEQEGQGAFKKANERVLAGRQMKGLPRRTATASTSFGSTSSQSTAIANGGGAETPPAPKFGGFGGFGAPASTNPGSSFSFSTPAVPAVSANASQKTKDFASLVSNSGFSSSAGTTSFPPPTSQPSKPAPSQPEEDQDDEAEYQYYLSLRGINVSIVTALSKAVEADPFADVSGMLEKYTSLRKQAQKDFDAKKGSKPTNNFSTPKPSSSPFSSGTSSSSTTTAPAPSFSMPKPPASFSGVSSSASAGVAPFSTKSTSSIQAFAPPKSSNATAFTSSATSDKAKSPETADKPTSRFAGFGGFGSGTPSATSEKANPPESADKPTRRFAGFGGFGSSKPSGATSSSAFGGSAKPSEGEGAAKEKDAAPAFSFGKPAVASAAGSLFGAPSTGGGSFGKPNDSSTTTSAGLFGKPAASTSSGFPFAAPPAASSSKSGNPFSFGAPPSSVTPAFGSSSSDAASKDGSTTPTKTNVFSGFGTTKTSPGGSLGNPVGFGFGSGFGSTAPPAFGSGTAGGSGGSLFSGTASSSGSQESAKKDESGDAAGQEEAEGTALMPSSQHDGKGEGEEDEESIYEEKAKCHILSTTDKDGKKTQSWNDLGLGIARVKKNKNDGTRRLLMRNSASGRIILNFALYQGFKPTLQAQPKGTLRFIGHSDGEKQTYMLKVGGEAKAKDLLALIEREVDALPDPKKS